MAPEEKVKEKSASIASASGNSGQTPTMKGQDADTSFNDTEQPDSEYPEGGMRAWATIAGAFCSQLCGFGYTTAFGVYQDYYTRFYITSENPSTISWIGSVDAFILLISGLCAGRLYDKGYFYHMVYGGSALISFSLFMLSLSQPDHIYQNFLAQAIGHGIGAGLTYIPSLAIVSHYFHRRRPLAMCIVASGAALGAVVHPIMLNNTFHRLGFGNAVRASAGLVSGLLLLSCILMRPRLPPPTKTPELKKTVKKLLKDIPYICVALGLMLFPFGMYYPLFYFQLDAVEHGLSENFAFYSLVIVNGASFLGRLSSGLLFRVIDIVPLAIITAGSCAVLILSLIGVTTTAGFVVVGLLWGFSCGVFISIAAPIIALLSDDISEIGQRLGIGFAMCGVGALAGPPVLGALLTKKFLWWRPTVFSGIAAIAATVFMVGMSVTMKRKERKARAPV